MAQSQITTAAVPPGTTVIYTTPSGAPAAQHAYVIPNKRAHVVLGIIQMILGCAVVALSVIGIIVGSPGNLTGSGIFSGVVFFVAGFVGLRAARENSRNYLIACLVISIIATVASIIASSTAGYERGSLMRFEGPRVVFQLAKCTVIIGACVVEFFISIAHAGVACGSCCGCCPAAHQPQPAPAASQVVIQQPSTGYQPMMQQQAAHVPQPGPYPGPQPPQQPMMRPPYQQPMAMPQPGPYPSPQPPQQPMPQPGPYPSPQPPQQPMPLPGPYSSHQPPQQTMPQPPYHQPIPMPQPYQQAMPPQPSYQQPMAPGHPMPPEYANPPPYSPEAVPTAPSAPPSAPTMEAGPLPPKV